MIAKSNFCRTVRHRGSPDNDFKNKSRPRQHFLVNNCEHSNLEAECLQVRPRKKKGCKSLKAFKGQSWTFICSSGLHRAVWWRWVLTNKRTASPRMHSVQEELQRYLYTEVKPSKSHNIILSKIKNFFAVSTWNLIYLDFSIALHNQIG